MILNVHISEQVFPIEVPESLVSEAAEFFDRMDSDLDRGYQMSRTWVDNPDRIMRCQIAADKMVTAMETENEPLKMMMAAYIVSRLPNVSDVYISIEGNMLEHEFETRG